MKTKSIITKIFLILVSLFILLGVLLLSLHFRVEGDLFRNAYYQKQKILENNSKDYNQITTTIKSIDRNIPIFSSPEPLMTNIHYDRIVLGTGNSFIIKNNDCKLFDNGQLVTLIQNNNKKRESYIFPKKTRPTFKSLFMIGLAYQNYLNDNQIIIDCSAIPSNKD